LIVPDSSFGCSAWHQFYTGQTVKPDKSDQSENAQPTLSCIPASRFSSFAAAWTGMRIYIDGSIATSATRKISVFDLVALRGTALWEGPAINGRVFKLKEHTDRSLFAKVDCVTLPGRTKHHGKRCRFLAAATGLRGGYIGLVVHPRVGHVGLNPLRCRIPPYIIADKIQLYRTALYQKGMESSLSRRCATCIARSTRAIKSLNYLNKSWPGSKRYSGCEAASC